MFYALHAILKSFVGTGSEPIFWVSITSPVSQLRIDPVTLATLEVKNTGANYWIGGNNKKLLVATLSSPHTIYEYDPLTFSLVRTLSGTIASLRGLDYNGTDYYTWRGTGSTTTQELRNFTTNAVISTSSFSGIVQGATYKNGRFFCDNGAGSSGTRLERNITTGAIITNGGSMGGNYFGAMGGDSDNLFSAETDYLAGGTPSRIVKLNSTTLSVIMTRQNNGYGFSFINGST